LARANVVNSRRLLEEPNLAVCGIGRRKRFRRQSSHVWLSSHVLFLKSARSDNAILQVLIAFASRLERPVVPQHIAPHLDKVRHLAAAVGFGLCPSIGRQHFDAPFWVRRELGFRRR